MSRRAFRIGAWAALAAAVVSAFLTVMAGVVGVLALTGKETYPVEYDLGPFVFRDTLSVPTDSWAPVCQAWDYGLLPNEYPDDDFCYKLVQDGPEPQNVSVDDGVWQDSNVWPTDVVQSGEIMLATSGSWHPWVAAQVVEQVLVWAVITSWLVVLWRLLARAASGFALTARTVRYLRALGWIPIAAAVLAPALDHFTSINVIESLHFWQSGPPFLGIYGTRGYPGGVDFVQVGLGALVLLVAEVFRHGASIETERRLTV